jgi:hypothetical protein
VLASRGTKALRDLKDQLGPKDLRGRQEKMGSMVKKGPLEQN